MRPGLSRAIPMGFLGFLVGALVVIIIRGLQGITPLWNTGVGVTLAAFTTAGFFVWGMGAFDPAMSAHGEAAEAARTANLDNAPPTRLLIGSTWQLVTLLIIFLVAVFGFATLPNGLKLTTTVVPDASVAMAGMVDMQIGSETVQVSQLTIFAIFIIFTFVSLVVAAGAIGWVMNGLAVGVKEAQLEAAGVTTSAPVEESQPEAGEQRSLVRTLLTAALFIGLFAVLYWVFKYVAIGLIAPKPDLPGLNIIFPDSAAQLEVLSLVNALLFTVLILRPTLLLQFVGRVARIVVNILKRVPNILQ